MTPTRTLNDLFPDWIDNGFFVALNQQSPPWANDVPPSDLDLIYHGSRSGGKLISPLLERLVITGALPESQREKLAVAAMSIYGKNWSKLYQTLSIDYNPIENYSMTETETGRETGTETGTTENDLTDSQSVKHTGTDTHAGTSSVTNNVTNSNSVFGFNSETSTPANDQTGIATGNNSTNDTQTLDLTDTTAGTQKSEGTHSTTTGKDNSRTLTRSGNIGVTTSQRMIQAEHELWRWNFFEHVFSDIDELLTLQIY